jgi:hypothetical protein
MRPKFGRMYKVYYSESAISTMKGFIRAYEEAFFELYKDSELVTEQIIIENYGGQVEGQVGHNVQVNPTSKSVVLGSRIEIVRRPVETAGARAAKPCRSSDFGAGRRGWFQRRRQADEAVVSEATPASAVPQPRHGVPQRARQSETGRQVSLPTFFAQRK